MATTATVRVQEFDYPGLVARMDEAGMDNYASILKEGLQELGRPRFQTERIYFWRALANAARSRDQVWLWLCCQMPGLNPTEFVHPQMVTDWELPEIRETDPSAKPVELPESMASESTEENFRAQAERLQQIFDERRGRIRSVREYVDTFRNSGSGQIAARFQLSGEGLLALAEPEGISWLIATYLPA